MCEIQTIYAFESSFACNYLPTVRLANMGNGKRHMSNETHLLFHTPLQREIYFGTLRIGVVVAANADCREKHWVSLNFT